MQEKIITEMYLSKGAVWMSYERPKMLDDETPDDSQLCEPDYVVKNLPSLREFILQKRKNNPDEKLFQTLEQFSYCVSGLCIAFYDLCEYLNKEGDRLRAAVKVDPERIAAYEVGCRSNRVNYLVDGFFEISVRLQNAFCGIISQATSNSFPPSFNDFMKEEWQKRIKHNKTLDPRLVSILNNYWNDHGKTLRNYRDLTQHQPTRNTDIVFSLNPEGDPIFSMILPNNPKAIMTNGHAPEFYNPQIQAFEYILFQFPELIKLCNNICDYLLPPEALEKGAQLKWRAFDVNKLEKSMPIQPMEQYKEMIRAIVRSKGRGIVTSEHRPRTEGLKEEFIYNIKKLW